LIKNAFRLHKKEEESISVYFVTPGQEIGEKWQLCPGFLL
jgi:hypothetical protein